MKYILVTGGVISGIGKGVLASSVGALLKNYGLRVTCIKIDPYINLDAGTFSPYEHGEVYVLDDGGEVDLDLGNYERFMDVTLHKDNNITTGKIYQSVINRERKGDYLGKTVQVVPHITDEIQQWVRNVARVPVDGSDDIPQVCIIELGGTIGDIESMAFVEAFRQFHRNERGNFCCMHLSMILNPNATGEMKTKPTQNSISDLRKLGLTADFVVCRSEHPIDEKVKDKISTFCDVEKEMVICLPDANSVYEVPLMLDQQRVGYLLNQVLHLGLPQPKPNLTYWKKLSKKRKNLQNYVKIALVGKYTRLNDAYASVIKALEHASLFCNCQLKLIHVESENLEESQKTKDPVSYHEAWRKVCTSNGILVPGGFGGRGFEGKVSVCQYARENKKPLLGVCLGLQAAVVEFSRNVLALENANTQENDPQAPHLVVIEMLEHNPGQMGGTMRLGVKETIFKRPNSKIQKLYHGKASVFERHRHRYEVNPKYVDRMEEKGLRFVGQDSTQERMEILELDNHPFYSATQYHPEYLTRPAQPSPPYLGLVIAAIDTLADPEKPDGHQNLNDYLALLPVEDLKSIDGTSSSEDETSRNLLSSNTSFRES